MEKTEAQAGALVFLSETFHHARDRVFAGDIGRGIAHRGLAEDAGDGDEEAFFAADITLQASRIRRNVARVLTFITWVNSASVVSAAGLIKPMPAQ
jgi:hypothetical protein